MITETYFTTKVAVTDEDDKPGTVDVTASIGEFDGVIVEMFTPGHYSEAQLTIEGCDELIAALIKARDILAAANA